MDERIQTPAQLLEVLRKMRAALQEMTTLDPMVLSEDERRQLAADLTEMRQVALRAKEKVDQLMEQRADG